MFNPVLPANAQLSQSASAPSLNSSKIKGNLCETHFPEPILYHLDRPVCKKCLPEYLKQQ